MRQRGSQTHAFGLTLALLLASCGGGGGGGPIVPVTPSDPVIAEAVIGPGGGSLLITTGVDAGLRLAVPAGAVQVATQFRVRRVSEDDAVPSLFPLYRIEPESLDLAAVPVTVTVPANEQLFVGGFSNLTLFQRLEAGTAWQVNTNATVDSAAKTVTASVSRLGEFLAWEGNLHRLFTQDLRLQDPAVPMQAEFLNGTQIAISNGTIARTVGRGSLASFWNSGASDNVLILHGVFGSPLDFLGPEDLVENLALLKSNVVLMSYPPARGVAYVANELYDLIATKKRAGFGCSIVGHSIGGLVARYMLEKSANDPSRRGFGSNQDALQGVVDQLILLGVPNAGASSSTIAFAAIADSLTAEDRGLLQVVNDLSEQPGSLPLVMNASYVNNPTRYHLIYGDLGTGTDGVVSVASALALPVTPPETATMFPVGHDDLHRLATSLGIAVWMGTLLQAQ